MQKMLFTFACVLALLANTTTAMADTQMDTTLRWTHTGWYEYPGNYFDEDFTLVGLRLTQDHIISESDVVGLSWGYGATLYPGSSYTGYRSVLETSGYAFGLGLEAFARGAYDVANAISLRAELRTEFSVLFGSGTDDNVVPYGEFFAHFLPLLTAAIGVEIPEFAALGADGLVIMARTAVLDIGMWTGNYIRNDPGINGWSDMSVEVGVRF